MALHFKYSADEILIPQNNTHATPPTGENALYVKTDGMLYTKNDAGVESAVGAGTTTAPANQIVYGTGSGVSSSSVFTFNPTSGAFTISPTSSATPGAITITGNTNTGGTGGAITITGGTAGSTNSVNGGTVTVKAGSGGSGTTSGGGALNLRGGDGVGSTGGGGGNVVLFGGTPTVQGAGGSIVIAAANGAGAGNQGGGFAVTCGDGVTNGAAGGMTFTAGNSPANGNGGAITFTAGDSSSGIAGNISFTAGTTSGTKGSFIVSTNVTERFRIDGSGAWQLASSAGTAGFVLTSAGTGAPPTWSSAPNSDYNLNNQLGYAVTASLASAGLTVAASHRAILRTILVTNLTAVQATLNADIDYGGTTPVLIASNMPIPGYSTVDLDLRVKVLLPSDLVRFQANAASTLHVTLVWEDNTITDYVQGTVANLNLTTNTITDVFTSAGTNGTVLESILVVNNSAAVQDVPITVVWTDAANVIQGYYSFNLMISYGGTVELLENPVRIPTGYKIRATAGNANTVAVHVSGKNV